MTRLVMLEKAWEFIYGTFKIRRVSLMALAALSVILGPFLRVLFLLPQWALMDIIYIYAGTLSVTGFFIWGAFRNTVKSLIGSVFLSWKYKPREFTPEEYSYYGVTQILNEMGIKKRVRIFETNNPWIEGPFTNAFSNRIYIPAKWRAENPRLDLRGVMGHELAHVKAKSKFAQEVALGIGGIVGLTFLVGWFSIPLVTETFELSISFLVLTALSWRNERRADWEGALVTGPEGLISVFERLAAKLKRDEGSETHPPLHDRISRLLPLLDRRVKL
jgi:Peptidase family M48